MTDVEPGVELIPSDQRGDMRALFLASEADRYELHSRHMNNMMVRVLKTIGFDVRFVSGKGAYLQMRPARAISTCSAAGACS